MGDLALEAAGSCTGTSSPFRGINIKDIKKGKGFENRDLLLKIVEILGPNRASAELTFPPTDRTGESSGGRSIYISYNRESGITVGENFVEKGQDGNDKVVKIREVKFNTEGKVTNSGRAGTPTPSDYLLNDYPVIFARGILDQFVAKGFSCKMPVAKSN